MKDKVVRVQNMYMGNEGIARTILNRDIMQR